MGRVFIFGPMALFTMVSGEQTKSTGLEFTFGLTVGSMWEPGKTTKCMDKERTHGPMAEVIQVNILMIESTVMELLRGVMAAAIKGPGTTVSSTEKACMN